MTGHRREAAYYTVGVTRHSGPSTEDEKDRVFERFAKAPLCDHCGQRLSAPPGGGVRDAWTEWYVGINGIACPGCRNA